MVGLLVAANRIAESKSAIIKPKFYLALLTAGVYLVVRGLDNAYQGFSNPDPFALKVISVVKEFLGFNELQAYEKEQDEIRNKVREFIGDPPI